MLRNAVLVGIQEVTAMTKEEERKEHASLGP